MKWLLILGVVAINYGIGSSYRIVEADVPSDDVTPQDCLINDINVRCNETNSRLPDDLKIDATGPKDEFVCLNVKYRKWISWKQINQCAPNIPNLCQELEKLDTLLKIHINNCICTAATNETTTTSSTTVTTTTTTQPSSSTSSSTVTITTSSQPTSSTSSSTATFSTSNSTVTSSSSSSTVTITTSTQPTSSTSSSPVTTNTPTPTKSSTSSSITTPTEPSTSTSTAEPSSTTEEPESGLYCMSDSGFYVECSNKTSLFPVTLVNDTTKILSKDYCCLNITYNYIGLYTYHAEQCAHRLLGGEDLCEDLRNSNHVLQCNLTDPIPESSTPTPLPTTSTTALPDDANSVSSSFALGAMLLFCVHLVNMLIHNNSN